MLSRATAERPADRQRAANAILDRAGVPRSVPGPDADVAQQALVERRLAMRATHVEEEPGEQSEVIGFEGVVTEQLQSEGGSDGGGAASSGA